MTGPNTDQRSRAPHRHELRRRRMRSPGVPGAVLDKALIDMLGCVDTPLSAYALASEARGLGHDVPVMSIYRALDRLVERGLVQKVETLSAYRLQDKAAAVLMICMQCGKTISLSMPQEFGSIVDRLPTGEFALRRLTIEAAGRCLSCRSALDKFQG